MAGPTMTPALPVRLLLAGGALAHVVANGCRLDAVLLRPLHVGLVLVAVLLLRPAARGARGPGWIDYAVAALAAAAIGYLVTRAGPLADARLPPRPPATFFGCALLAALAEAVRRTAGVPALALVAALAATALLAGGDPLDLPRTIALLFEGPDGVRGAPVGASAGVVALLCVLAALLEQAGYARSIRARAQRRPADRRLRAALADTVGAALIAAGTVGARHRENANGSDDDSLARATGCGAVLAPPVLGAAAVLAGVRTGTPYATLAAACLVPALAYFALVFARRLHDARGGAPAAPADGRATGAWTPASGTALGALLLFGGLLAAGMASVPALLVALAAGALACGLTPGRATALLAASSEGARTLLPLAVACIAASVLWTLCAATGLEARIAAGVTAATGGAMLPAILCAVPVSLVLGRCVPVAYAYIAGAVFVAPSLVAAGVPPLPAHLAIVLCAIIAAGLTHPSRRPRTEAPVPR